MKKKKCRTKDLIWDTMIRNLQYIKEPEDPKEKAKFLKPRASLGKNVIR